jgi:cytochrome c556
MSSAIAAFNGEARRNAEMPIMQSEVCFMAAHPDGSSPFGVESMFAALQHLRSRARRNRPLPPFSRELLQGGHASVSA